jgi:ArsR family transcriptional regulator
LKHGKSEAVAALAALAQEHRLEVYRLLVQAGPAGRAAGQVAAALAIAPNSLTFISIGCVMPDW